MPATIHKISCDDALAFICDATWGFAEVDPAGNFTWVNPAYCTILNAPADLIIGTTYQQWTYIDDVTIDQDLALKVKLGELPGYNLAKRYVQRGSTPKNQRVVWGMLSVSGKWSPTGEFLGYRVQFRPYDNLSTFSMGHKIDLRKWIQWTMTNWKMITTCVVVLMSLIFGGSEKLLETLRKAKDVKDSVDTVLQPSSSGASSAHPTP